MVIKITKNLLSTIVLTATLALTGCIDQGGNEVGIGPGSGSVGPNSNNDYQRPDPQQETNTQTLNGEVAAVEFTLPESALEPVTRSYRAEDLSYKFSYIDIKREGKLVIENGQGKIAIKALPVGKEGKLVLQIYKGETLYLHGEKDAVKLIAAETNNVELALTVVPNNTVTTTELEVNVSTPTTPTTPTTPVAETPVTPTTPTTPVVETPVTPTIPVVETPTVETPNSEIGDWDGKSFRGNNKWKVVPR